MPKRRTNSQALSKAQQTVWEKVEQLGVEDSAQVEITVGIDFKLSACYQSVGNQVTMKATAMPQNAEHVSGVLREAVEELAGGMIADTKATVQALTSIRDELE